jgi:hypothetical protein
MAIKTKSTKVKSKSAFEGVQTGKVKTLSSASTLTVYELGNIAHGIFPTVDELNTFKKLIEEINNGEKNAIFMPEGLVRVTQYHL